MKLFTLVALSLILYGCSVSNNFSGKYLANGNKIEIKEDSSFFYEYQNHYVYYQSSGKWEKIGRRIIVLNSTIKNNEIPMTVKSARLDTTDSINTISINLQINQETQKSHYDCLIFIDNDKVFSIPGKLPYFRGDSMVNLKINQPINTIYLMIGYKHPNSSHSNTLVTNKYVPENSENNKLEITVDAMHTDFFYEVFNSIPVRIKKGKIKVKFYKRWATLLKVSDDRPIFRNER